MNDSTWTWMGGSSTAEQSGEYGTQGNPSTENVPGARIGAVGWYDDSAQEFWVFGGYGISSEYLGMLFNFKRSHLYTHHKFITT